ncbi:OLC1v1007944C1 [Oldenlandia corymbosa var. corymbosa]|uniref:OLC1v1007944C1 n=1 Tax=Oldenlandia corymbosa var. corymbosa TaxID=529605 RepID=A0AAV1DKH8_OLDCO|nr:OLC1v1007944C1 [Oldenlandia corymbosa var. corymbosa]
MITGLCTSLVSGDPNTGIVTQDCSFLKYPPDDPHQSTIAYVLNDVMTMTPTTLGYMYFDSTDPSPSGIAFGHGSCEMTLSQQDCAACMTAAYNEIQFRCAGHGFVEIFIRVEEAEQERGILQIEGWMVGLNGSRTEATHLGFWNLRTQKYFVCTDGYGRRGKAPIRDDESMSWIYRGAHSRPTLYVEVANEPVQDVGEGTSSGQYDGVGASGVGVVPSIFDDINNMDKSELHEDSDGITMWDGNWQTVRHGVHFANKKEVRTAVGEWSLRQGRACRVKYSRPYTWATECETKGPKYPEELLHGTTCLWKCRATSQKDTNTWRMVVWIESHNCLGATTRNEARNLTSTMIARLITANVRKDPGYSIAQIQVEVNKRYRVTPYCKKEWHGRRKALDSLYGTWESNLQQLSNFQEALLRANPDTRMQIKFTKDTKNRKKVCMYIFWAFGPAIHLFRAAWPVITVDATHLRGSYKAKLIVACVKCSNNTIVPIAFALVDEKTLHSWKWFLKYLKKFVLLDKETCMISDRHMGILAAMDVILDKFPGMGVHRYCLQHIKTNKLFQENIDEINKCHSPLVTNPMKRYDEYRIHQMGHKVTRFRKRNQKYQMITYSLPDRPWKGGNIHEVSYAARMCTCYKWQAYRFPCSHALAVARFLRHDPLPLFDSFYSREQWAIQFSREFNPVLQPWPQVTWQLRPDDTLLVHHAGPGRTCVNRKKGLMDYTKKFGNKRVQVCGRCHQEGHNASACAVEKVCPRCGGFDHDTFNCAFSHPSSDRTPLNHAYDRYGIHGVPRMQTDDSDDQSSKF